MDGVETSSVQIDMSNLSSSAATLPLPGYDEATYDDNEDVDNEATTGEEEGGGKELLMIAGSILIVWVLAGLVVLNVIFAGPTSTDIQRPIDRPIIDRSPIGNLTEPP